jgi:hypothetical protein
MRYMKTCMVTHFNVADILRTFECGNWWEFLWQVSWPRVMRNVHSYSVNSVLRGWPFLTSWWSLSWSKILVCYGIRSFITVFVYPPVEPTLSEWSSLNLETDYLTSILILSYHLHVVLQSGLFPIHCRVMWTSVLWLRILMTLITSEPYASMCYVTCHQSDWLRAGWQGFDSRQWK